MLLGKDSALGKYCVPGQSPVSGEYSSSGRSFLPSASPVFTVDTGSKSVKPWFAISELKRVLTGFITSLLPQMNLSEVRVDTSEICGP